MALIYFIVDDEDRIPILTASNLEKVLTLLDEYMGFGNEGVEYLGFEEFDNCGYPDIYEGMYKYRTDYAGEQKFLRYCLELDKI